MVQIACLYASKGIELSWEDEKGIRPEAHASEVRSKSASESGTCAGVSVAQEAGLGSMPSQDATRTLISELAHV